MSIQGSGVAASGKDKSGPASQGGGLAETRRVRVCQSVPGAGWGIRPVLGALT